MKVKITERGLCWLMLAIIVACFTFNYAAIFDKKMDSNGDNYFYYHLAQSLVRGNGYVSDIGPVPKPHTHFPPGYPAFLSLFYHIFPDNIVALKLINGLLLLISILLLFRIVRKTTGRQGHWIALATCLLTACHPELLRWSTILMSEMLYITLTLSIIALCLDLDLEKIRRKDIRHILMLAGLCLLIIALYFVRTMGISLILAVALTFLLLAMKAFAGQKKEAPGWFAPLLAAALVILSFFIAKGSWGYRNQRVSPDYKNDYLNTFTQPASGENPDNKVTFFLNRIKNNLMAFVPYYIPNSLIDPDMAKFNPLFKEENQRWVPGILIIFFMLIGLLSMKRLSLLLILYFVITFGALFLYPAYYADLRYFIPLLPLMFAALVAGICCSAHFLVQYIIRKKPAFKLQKWTHVLIPALALLMLALLLPKYYSCQKSYRKFAAYESYGQMPDRKEYQSFLDMSAACAQFPKDWLFVTRKPEIFYFHSRGQHSLSMPQLGLKSTEVVRFLRDNRVSILVLDAFSRTYSTVIMPAMIDYPKLFSVIYRAEDGSGAIVGFLPNLPLDVNTWSSLEM